MALVNVAVARTLTRRATPGPSRAVGLLLYRNYLAYRRGWPMFATGFLEPVFYLFSIGIGVGRLIHGFEVGGHEVPYTRFVAPAMLASSALNGALLDSTFNFFFKMKYDKLFVSVLATPLSTLDVARGWLAWCLLRSGLYSAAFLAVMVAMGLVASWWALLAVPAALLIAFAVAGAGMALTTFMRSWQDFELVNLAVIPMFLFSATFFPITALPSVVRWIVEVTPLYRGVAMCRELTTGHPGWASLISVIYLSAIGLAGVLIARQRLQRLLLT